jgi:hypothetical protein
LLPHADRQYRLTALSGHWDDPFFHGPRRGRPFRDDVLGAPLCRIFERSATGPLPACAPPPPSFGLYVRRGPALLGWWWRGLARPNPFFDDHTGAPLSAPRVITASERAAL